jgi:16S rRNA (adenine1518-N6/adenine1519-N6)-dimethyltransferase
MKLTGPNSLGQHTLTDFVVMEQIIREANLTKTEKVLEIGAGEGDLTSQLCRNADRVTSLEIDRAKFEFTRLKLAKCKNLHLLNVNPFSSNSMSFEFDVCVSNIPYSRSKEIILWLSNQKFNRAVIMVQTEFARKLSSKPGTKSYRAISVICEYCFIVKELFEVSSTSFSPPPAVSSQVIKLVPSGRQISYNVKKNIEVLFSQRKRNVRKVASVLGLKSGSDLSKRICQLSPHEIVDLASRISI